jgi:hypothetical protein
MPIDPRIPLGGTPLPAVQPLQLPNPLEIMQTVAQIQGVREQTEARRLAAEAARTKHLQQQALDAAYAQAVKVDEHGELSIDYPALVRHLPGHLVPDVIRELQTDKTNALTLKEKTLELNAARQKHLGSAAQTVVAAGGDQKIWRLELDAARNLGALDDQTYQQLSAVQDPQQILALAQSFVQRAGLAPKPPALQKITTVDAQGNTVDQFVVPKEGATYAHAPKDATLQAKDVLLDGRPALATFNPQTGTYAVGGQDVTARVRPIPPQGAQPSYQWAVPPGASKPVLMTPQEIRASGATAVGAAGEAGGMKLGTAQQAEIATMLTAEQMAADVAKLGAETNWAGVGPWEGRVGATVLGSGGAKGETLRNQIGNIQATVALMRGGTSFTDTEKALLETYTPTTTDSDTKIQTKLTNLVDFIQKKRANVLRVARGEYTLPSTAAPTTPTAAPPAGGGGLGLSFQDYQKSKGGR